jgi:hypothetical protein
MPLRRVASGGIAPCIPGLSTRWMEVSGQLCASAALPRLARQTGRWVGPAELL